MSDDTNTTEPAPARSAMRFRRLRIAVSVFFAVVTVALCVLWVRSYFWMDCMSVPIWLATVRGTLYLNQLLEVPQGISDEVIRFNARLIRFEIDSMPLGTHSVVPVGPLGLAIPFWAIVVPVAAIAALPWFPFSTRFSLRTFLIATTLVAVVLGLIAFFK